jgi:hypothetical protein
MHGTADLGEVIPSFIFDTSAEVEANNRFNLTLVVDFLGVPGRFGHPTASDFSPIWLP